MLLGLVQVQEGLGRTTEREENVKGFNLFTATETPPLIVCLFYKEPET